MSSRTMANDRILIIRFIIHQGQATLISLRNTDLHSEENKQQCADQDGRAENPNARDHYVLIDFSPRRRRHIGNQNSSRFK